MSEGMSKSMGRRYVVAIRASIASRGRLDEPPFLDAVREVLRNTPERINRETLRPGRNEGPHRGYSITTARTPTGR